MGILEYTRLNCFSNTVTNLLEVLISKVNIPIRYTFDSDSGKLHSGVDVFKQPRHSM